MYDVVVVGAGLGGLTSALALAKKGKKVAIVEKHFLPGGYATNFHRKGTNGQRYEFDVSLHGIGGLNEGAQVHQLFKELDILEKVTLLRKAETGTLLDENTEIDIPDSFEAYKSLLIARFPAEEKGIHDLFAFLWALHEDMEKVYKNEKAPTYFQDLQSITIETFLKRYVDNSAFIEFFSFLWLYYGLPVDKLSALYYLLPWISYHIGGTYYIEGGAQALSDVLVAEIKRYGGVTQQLQKTYKTI